MGLTLTAGATARPQSSRTATFAVSVTALPYARVLAVDKLTTVVARTNLAFRVAVHNRSGSQQSATVSLRLGRQPSNFGPVVRTASLRKLRAYGSKTFIFTHLGTRFVFAVKEKLIISVKSASGKTFSTAYLIIFSVG